MIASEFMGKEYVFRALEMRYGDFSKRGPMIVFRPAIYVVLFELTQNILAHLGPAIKNRLGFGHLLLLRLVPLHPSPDPGLQGCRYAFFRCTEIMSLTALYCGPRQRYQMSLDNSWFNF